MTRNTITGCSDPEDSLEISDLPSELLERIFQYLDKCSQLAVSSICPHWRSVIHTHCWQSLNNKVKRLQYPTDQLGRWGWQEEEHQDDQCLCIHLHLDNFPLGSKGTKSAVRETRVANNQSLHTTCAITSDKVFVGITTQNDNIRSTPHLFLPEMEESFTLASTNTNPPTQVLVYNRVTLDSDPVSLITYPSERELHLYSFENTLVILEKDTPSSIFSINRVEDFKLSLWDTRSLIKVEDIDFLSILPDELVNIQNVHTEISDIAISKDSIAIHIFLTKLDWLQPEEILHNPQSKNITLFWNLYTEDPGENLSLFKYYITESLVEDCISDTGFIFLNNRFFLRYLSGLISEAGIMKFVTKVQVFSRSSIDHEDYNPWIVDINNVDVLDFIDCNEDSIKLEPGNSSRLSTFHLDTGIFKIIDIEKKEHLLQLDICSGFQDFPVVFPGQFHDSNWIGGNFIFLIESPKLDSSRKLFQLVLVSEEEIDKEAADVQKYSQRGCRLISALKREEFLGPGIVGTSINIDMMGVTVVTEELLLNFSFLDGL